MNYLKKRRKQILFSLFLCLAYNLYFIFLLPEVKMEYLLYLDFLLAAAGCFFAVFDYLKFRNFCHRKAEMMQLKTIIYQEFPDMEDYDIAVHDTEVLQGELKEQFDLNCDLQDYIAKWCHEVKIPLAASLLMIEKIGDETLRLSVREQLEHINHQLKSALLGCKVQSVLFDIQIKSVSLPECVRTSIHNNQFFLIRNHFRLETEVDDCFVYTDKAWLVYVLDQLISNAVKYAMEQPMIKIRSEQTKESVRLFLKDYGEGIAQSDIRRIFEKGYTGSSHHNGKYKSTGMGLYMTAKILKKLGHDISVESRKGSYTSFCIEMKRVQ